MQKKDYELDLEVNSPSDYTIMVSGLDENFNVAEVRQFFEAYGREDQESVEIERTNICYDIHEYVEMSREHFKQSSKLQMLKEYKARGETIPSDTTCFCCKGDEWDE